MIVQSNDDLIAAAGAVLHPTVSVIEISATWHRLCQADDRGALHVVPPCGRCREFIGQIDPSNLDTEVVLGQHRTSTLRELLPSNDWPAPLN